MAVTQPNSTLFPYTTLFRSLLFYDPGPPGARPIQHSIPRRDAEAQRSAQRSKRGGRKEQDLTSAATGGNSNDTAAYSRVFLRLSLRLCVYAEIGRAHV